MRTITESEHEIPVLIQADVVVAGGGPSGFAAAVAAARNGAKTVLVEQSNFAGSLMTCMPILGFYNYQGKQVIFGIAQELVDRLVDLGASPGHVVDPRLSSVTVVDPEMTKLVTQNMLEEAGVDIIFHTMAVSPFMEAGTVRGVIVESKSGRQAILADVVIDATGDGDIAARAGAPYEMKEKENIQPGNLIFRMDNVNVDKIRLAVARDPDKARTVRGQGLGAEYFLNAERFVLDGFVDEINQARKNGDLPADYPQSWVMLYTLPRSDEVGLNMAMAINFYSTDAEDLTQAEMQARKRIPIVVDFLRKYIPGFEKAHLTVSHGIIGVRESRRIMGDYVLSTEDVLQGNTFPDGIAIAPWAPSLGHHPKGHFTDKRYPKKDLRGCEVPYRCLVPRKIEGLLVAGRCISVTGESQNAIRVMAPCMALGQAAGSAAALAVKDKISPRNVDTAKLRQVLVEQGVYFLEG